MEISQIWRNCLRASPAVAIACLVLGSRAVAAENQAAQTVVQNPIEAVNSNTLADQALIEDPQATDQEIFGY